MEESEFGQLIEKYQQGTLPDAEKAIVDEWFESLGGGNPAIWTEQEENALKARIMQQIDAPGATGKRVLFRGKIPETQPAKRGKEWRIAAAACILVLLSAGTWLFFARAPEQTGPLVSTVQTGQDVLPGGHKAVLTLADGQNIVLDNAPNGLLAQQGPAKVVKESEEKVTYTTPGTAPGEVIYNTLTTPKGGQFQVQLPDGTEVWLNAASSIRFPTGFKEHERVVEITGEVYFEVSKLQGKNSRNMPFTVKVNDAAILVLGTHFNVKAYDDEQTVKATLLEGTIKVNRGTESEMLVPGQQAVLNKSDGTIMVMNEADMEGAVAWKNGLFRFSHADLKTVMNELARWYDVKVTFAEDTIPEQYFEGEIQRDLNLTQVLNILEKSRVKFRMEGRTIIIGTK